MRLIPLALALSMLGGCALSPQVAPRVAASPGAKAGSSADIPLARVQQRIDQRRHVCASSGVRANRGGYC